MLLLLMIRRRRRVVVTAIGSSRVVGSDGVGRGGEIMSSIVAVVIRCALRVAPLIIN